MGKLVFVKAGAKKICSEVHKEELFKQGWKLAGKEEQKSGTGSLEDLEEEIEQEEGTKEEVEESAAKSAAKPAAKPAAKKKTAKKATKK